MSQSHQLVSGQCQDAKYQVGHNLSGFLQQFH